MGPFNTPLGNIKNIKYEQEMLEESNIVRCFCVCICSNFECVKKIVVIDPGKRLGTNVGYSLGST